MIRSMSIRFVVVGASIGVLCMAPVALESQSPAAVGAVSLPSLVTSGQGEAKVTPDRVSVLVNVQTRATTAAAAAATNAQRTKAVLDALGRLGLPKDQL